MALHESGGKGGENSDERIGQGGEENHIRQSITHHQHNQESFKIEDDAIKLNRSKTLGIKGRLAVSSIADEENKGEENEELEKIGFT